MAEITDERNPWTVSPLGDRALVVCCLRAEEAANCMPLSSETSDECSIARKRISVRLFFALFNLILCEFIVAKIDCFSEQTKWKAIALSFQVICWPMAERWSDGTPDAPIAHIWPHLSARRPIGGQSDFIARIILLFDSIWYSKSLIHIECTAIWDIFSLTCIAVVISVALFGSNSEIRCGMWSWISNSIWGHVLE